MTEASIWPTLMQGGAFAVVLLALAAAAEALYSAWRRHRLEHELHRRSLDLFEEKLRTARVQRREREREIETWSGWRKFLVSRVVDEGGGIRSYYLEPHDRKPIPGFRPGQYLTFSLRIPGEPRPVVRCYSLSDAPREDGCYRVSIKRVPPPRDKPHVPPGKSSGFFHDHIGEGDILDCRAPSGDFFLDLAKPQPVVLIGGGIGITPVLAMLNAVAARGFDREVWFFYGVRNAEEHVMAEHLAQLARAHPDKLHLHVCYSQADEADLPSEPPVSYHAEIVSVDLFRRVLPSSNFDYYICGPPPMMDSLTHALDRWGVPGRSVHFESFGPATVKKTPRAEDATKVAGPALTIRFERSGKEAPWDPSAGTLLDFAEAHGVAMDYGCRAGSCMTCVTAIKSGEVEYLSDPGAEPEAGTCLACIAVPKQDLVLDA